MGRCAEYEMSEAEYAISEDRCTRALRGSCSNSEAEQARKDEYDNELTSDGKPIWRCKDGRQLTVDQMGLGHIINSIWMLKRNGFSAEKMEFVWYDSKHIGDMAAFSLDNWNMRASQNKFSPWFKIFHNELIKRGFTQEQIDSWYDA